MNQQAIQEQALSNARNNASMANYGAIFEGFIAKGIPADQIEPRVNVFTFHAWKALGRSVRKGEHGVKVCTYIPMTKTEHAADGDKEVSFRAPRMTTVFHVSQTDAIAGASALNVDTGHCAVPPTLLAAVTAAREAHTRAVRPDYYSEQFTPTA